MERGLCWSWAGGFEAKLCDVFAVVAHVTHSFGGIAMLDFNRRRV